MRWMALLGLALVLFGCEGGGSGAADTQQDAVERPNFSKVDCIKLSPLRSWTTNPSAVAVLFTVEDCTNVDRLTALPGLETADFVVLEDGTKLSSEAHRDVLPSRGLHIGLTLLLDMSDSTLPNRSQIVMGARSFVEEILVTRELEDRVKIGVELFDGSAMPAEWVKPPSDVAKLKSKLGELADYAAADGGATNLYGSLRQGVEDLQVHLDDVMERNHDGVVATGHLVVFTDGGDSAGREGIQGAASAVSRARILSTETGSPSPVVQTWGVALKGEDYDAEVFRQLLGPQDRFLGEADDVDSLAETFELMGEQIAKQVQGTYLFAYCSTKRAATHEVSIELRDDLADEGTWISYTFSAENFAGGCNANFFETSCDSKECGGFNCGGCDDEVAYCTSSLRCMDFCEEAGYCETTTFVNGNDYEQTCEISDTTIKCGGECVDSATSDDHCGRCNNRCSAEGSWCEGGICVCSDNQTACDGICRDPLWFQTEHEHCGACGQACQDAEVCRDGTCYCESSVCDGACRAPGWFLTNSNHCGECGLSCGEGYVCSGGQCVCAEDRDGDLVCDHVDACPDNADCGYYVDIIDSEGAFSGGITNGGSIIYYSPSGYPTFNGGPYDSVIWVPYIRRLYHVMDGEGLDGVGPGGRIVAMASTSNIGCALNDQGAIQCFGREESEPPRASYVAFTMVGQIAYALDEDGEADCWVTYRFGSPECPEPLVGPFVSLGGSCGVRESGELACWGFVGGASVPSGNDFVQVDSDYQTVCGLRRNGSVVCGGNEIEGSFSQIRMSSHCHCGLTSSGQVSCWYQHDSGSGDLFRCGPPSAVGG